ncbi:MAG: OmpA family protein [Limisphaerales bacterium]
MKLNKFANLLVIGLVLTVAASGCRKKPVNVTELPGARAGKVSDMGPGGAIPPAPPMTTEQGLGGVTGGHPSNPANLHEGWPEDAQALKAETVYFDFDRSVVKTVEKPKVAAVADYLKANSANAVRIEGNCDERGTEEYNRALGERRALAVREELIRLGIDPTRIDTISYGKDRPAAQGHDESAWRLNRRDDFIVLTPPK